MKDYEKKVTNQFKLGMFLQWMPDGKFGNNRTCGTTTRGLSTMFPSLRGSEFKADEPFG